MRGSVSILRQFGRGKEPTARRRRKLTRISKVRKPIKKKRARIMKALKKKTFKEERNKHAKQMKTPLMNFNSKSNAACANRRKYRTY